MAGASAKKAAAAQKAAAKFYLPLLLVANVVYWVVRQRSLGGLQLTWSGVFMIFLLWGLQAYAYQGILHNAANRSSQKGTSLVGGASLDVLGLTLAIQYLAILWTPTVYWALVVFPLWGAYSLYQTFRGGGGAGSDRQSSAEQAPVDDKVVERRQQRAERRQRKRK